MNSSFSILQKLKNQFFQSVPTANKKDFHVAFAPFAFTLSNDDFYFLKNDIVTGSQTRKYYKEQSEFAVIANSVLKKPNIWSIDTDNLLYNSFKNILESALTIDPNSFTADETLKLEKAKQLLYKNDGEESDSYAKYKTFLPKISEIEKQIIEHDSKKNSIDSSDLANMQLWNLKSVELKNEKNALLIDWEVIGFKSAIESAKKTYEAIVFSKINFIQQWNDTKNNKLTSPNLLTDQYGVDFLVTTCIPNSICDYQSPIWKKISIDKTEIEVLTKAFTNEIPAEVLAEFGNTELDLLSISFEYCILDIQRPWFDESLINNSLWTYVNKNQKVSFGDDSMRGEIPAYPIKIILSKNIELEFTQNSTVNEDVKNKLKNGTKLFFGPLLLKNIPLNLADEDIKNYKVQQLTTKELSVITKANATVSLKDSSSKYKMIEQINKQPQQVLKNNIQLKTVNPIMLTNMKMVNLSKQPKQNNPLVAAGSVRDIRLENRAVLRPEILRPTAVLRPPVVTNVFIPPPKVIENKVKVTGKVVDSSNQALSVVEVQLMNEKNASTQSVLTLDDGTYAIDAIEKGTYQFKVRKTGYVIQEKEVTIANDSNFDFLLPNTPTLTESFQVMGVICKKLPELPLPKAENIYL